MLLNKPKHYAEPVSDPPEMTGRFRLALRQWRRTLVGAALLSVFILLCIAFGYEGAPPNLLEKPTGWIALALTGLIVSVALTLIGALLIPGLLSLIELWGVTLIAGVLVFSATEAIPSMPELNGLWNCAILMAVFLLVHKALYGDWQASFLRSKPRTTKRTIKLRSDPQTVWNALLPDPNRATDHYWTGTTFLDAPDPTSANFIMCRPRRGGLKDEILEVQIENTSPFESFTMKSWPANANDKETPVVRLTVHLQPTASGGTRLRVEETLLRYAYGQRLMWWLSNDLSDHLHSMRAKIDGRSDGSIHGSQMIPANRLEATTAI